MTQNLTQLMNNEGINKFMPCIEKEKGAVKTALFFMINNAQNNIPLSHQVIKRLNIILSNQLYSIQDISNDSFPGEYRKTILPDKPDPKEIEGLIGQLVSDISTFNGTNASFFAAYFLTKFIEIAPFGQGNLITGILAMNYILIKRGINPVIISEHLNALKISVDQYLKDDSFTALCATIRDLTNYQL